MLLRVARLQELAGRQRDPDPVERDQHERVERVERELGVEVDLARCRRLELDRLALPQRRSPRAARACAASTIRRNGVTTST
jgi:hypothetical protein